jgi:hypothetical protein
MNCKNTHLISFEKSLNALGLCILRSHMITVQYLVTTGTTTQILRDGTLLLTESVTKYNRLVKCPAINGGGRFIYRATKK